jgi:acetylornithine deacetylase/succinyl-diaminopimelate desuccinylase-like protein
MVGDHREQALKSGPEHEAASGMEAIDRYLEEHRAAFEEDLKAFLRIPSVSAQKSHQPDVRRAAEWLADQFRPLGFRAEILPTRGHPLVLAEWRQAPGKPTVLVYGHYDVQPPDPLEQWISPPFEPTVRGGNIHARGATDDKGQMLTHVKSAEAWLHSYGHLPLNIRFLIEGEEEIGSENLNRFVRESPDRLRCDWVVISDTSMFAPDTPSICYGLRGIAYFEVTVHGPRQDLHSGAFGGMVTNPANTLAQLLGSLTDGRGRVQVPGFYDDVVPLSPAERRRIAELPFDETAYCAMVGVEAFTGEEGYTALERKWARPTCDVCGLYGGYSGEGSKTIIPSRAGAKVSFRLVPDQDPRRIGTALRQYLESRRPPGVRVEVHAYHGDHAVVMPTESAGMEAAKRALRTGFQREPVFIRSGGSIPVVGTFRRELHVDCFLLGFGLPDDNTHSPNEKFCLRDFHRGIKTSAYLWKELAAVKA